MNTSPTSCPDCGVTHAAAGVLSALLTDLRASRPDDPSWGVDVCVSCGRVTGVWDDAEGWGFGTRPGEVVRAPLPLHKPFVSVLDPEASAPVRMGTFTA
jgi:hypothetical protein